MTILPETLSVFTEYEMIVYGLVLIVIMILLPQGLVQEEYWTSMSVRNPGQERLSTGSQG